jgi:hypothetical protein
VIETPDQEDMSKPTAVCVNSASGFPNSVAVQVNRLRSKAGLRNQL